MTEKALLRHLQDINKLQEYLLARSIPEPNSGCRLWEASLYRGGYGQVSLSRPRLGISAHRLSYLVFVDPELNLNEDVHHICETEGCIEPLHLESASRSWHRLQHINGGAGNFCKNGHDLGIYGVWYSRGLGKARYCLICNREKMRRLRLQWKAQ